MVNLRQKVNKLFSMLIKNAFSIISRFGSKKVSDMVKLCDFFSLRNFKISVTLDFYSM